MLGKLWKWLQARVHELFFEDKFGMSLSRIILVILVFNSLYFWNAGKDIPSTMMTFLITIVGYVFGQKVLSSVPFLGGIANNPLGGGVNTQMPSTINQPGIIK